MGNSQPIRIENYDKIRIIHRKGCFEEKGNGVARQPLISAEEMTYMIEMMRLDVFKLMVFR